MSRRLDSWEEEVEAVVWEFAEEEVKEGLVASGGVEGGGGWFQRWRTGVGRSRWFLKTLNTCYVKQRKHVLLLQTVSCIFFLLYTLKPSPLSLILNNNTPSLSL